MIWRRALAIAALLWPASTGQPDIEVVDWAYQLQEMDLQLLVDSSFDLLVLDYSLDGDEASELSAAQVAALRQGGVCGGHTVLAYLSIGEAEDYRFYWDDDWVDASGDPTDAAPSWLGPANPDFGGNYKVRYWDRDWQRIVFGAGSGQRSYLDRIIDAGFDGVYLDIIDGYEHWGPEAIGGTGERPTAPADMVRLVRDLARHARRTRGVGDFLVVPQNGAGVIDAASYPDAADPEREAKRQRRRYFRAIDGIGAEDTFFFGDRDQNNPYRPQHQVITLLEQFAAAGKTVLAIDYLTRRDKIDRFWGEATARGWLPHVSRRDLDRLTLPAGHEPTCGPA